MLEKELIRLRNNLKYELDRRKKVEECLKNQKVKEFIKLINLGYIDTSLDELKALRYILKRFHTR